VNKQTDTFDVSTELSGFGLQGVQVTEDELRDLVAELGLDGDEAGDLVKGLSSATPSEPEPPVSVKQQSVPEPAVKPDDVAAEDAPKASESEGNSKPDVESAEVEPAATIESASDAPSKD